MASTASRRRGRKSHDFQERKERFDTAWQGTRVPAIEEFLPPPETAESHGYTRRQLLLELVEIDMECRWRAGFPRSHFDSIDDRLPSKPRVEDYLEWFPELGPADQLPVDLIVHEYKNRVKAGERIEHGEYGSRFAALAERLVPALRDADTNMTEPTARYVRCPQCHSSIEVPELTAVALEVVTCQCGEKVPIIDARRGDQREGEKVVHYELVRWLGRGSFANVWLAFDERLERHVALKIPYARRKGEERPNLIINEAKIVAGLKHPNIVQVYDLGHGDDAYIASEYINGQNLEVSLRVRPRAPEETAALCRKMAEALHYLHGKGIVHRDVKPSNILLDEHEEPHLTDFGLAKRESESIALSSAGELIGTVAYMSPEQAAGKGHRADGRADIFSLGVVMYEMLAGTLPFHGDRLTIMNKIQKEDPASIRKHAPKTPRDLETICFRCLEKEPAKRFATAAELAEELGRYLRGEPIRTRPASRFERLQKWAKRHPARAIAASMSTVAAAAVVVALGLTMLRTWERDVQISKLVKNAGRERLGIIAGLSAANSESDVRNLKKGIDDLIAIITDLHDLAPEIDWQTGEERRADDTASSEAIAELQSKVDEQERTIRHRESLDELIRDIGKFARDANENHRAAMALLGSALFARLPVSRDEPTVAAMRRSPADASAESQDIADRIAGVVDPDVVAPKDAGALPDPASALEIDQDAWAGIAPTALRFPGNEVESLRELQKSAGAALAALGIDFSKPESLRADFATLLWNQMEKANRDADQIASGGTSRYHQEQDIEPLQAIACELILLHAHATYQLGLAEKQGRSDAAAQALDQLVCAERIGVVDSDPAPSNLETIPTPTGGGRFANYTYRHLLQEFSAARDGLPAEAATAPLPSDATALDYFFAGCRRMPTFETDNPQDAYRAALEHFKSSYVKDPERIWTGYFMAVCCIRLGDPEEAEIQLTRHAHQIHDFPFSQMLLGMARSQIYRRDPPHGRAEFEGAVTDFGAVLTMVDETEQMSEAVAARLRFAALVSRGALRFDAAQQQPPQLERETAVLRSSAVPDTAFDVERFAHLDLAASDFTEAARIAEEARDTDRANLAEGQLVLVRIAQERLDEARTIVDGILSRLSNDDDAQKTRAALLTMRAELRLKQKDPAGAAGDFLEVYMDNAVSPAQRASAGVQYAWILGFAPAGADAKDAADVDDAIRVCDEVIALAHKGTTPASKSVQQRALDAHLIAAILRVEAARKLARKLVQLRHASAEREALRERIEQYHRVALASLEAYLARRDDDPNVYEMRGNLRLRVGGQQTDMAGAAEDYRRATELLAAAAKAHPPGSSDRRRFERAELRLQRLCGWCLARLGQGVHAVAAFDRAIDQLGDPLPQTRIGRGFAHVLTKEKRELGLADAEHAARESTDAYDLYQAAGIYALAAGYADRADPKTEQAERNTFHPRAERCLQLLETALKAATEQNERGSPHPQAVRILAFGNSPTFRAVWNLRAYNELMLKYAKSTAVAKSGSASGTIPAGGTGGGK